MATNRPLTPELRERRLADLSSCTRGNSSAVVVLQGMTSEILWANPEAEALLGEAGRFGVEEKRHLVCLEGGTKASASWLLAVHRLACGVSRHETLTLQLPSGPGSPEAPSATKTVTLRLYLLHRSKKGPEFLGVISTCHVSSCSTDASGSRCKEEVQRRTPGPAPLDHPCNIGGSSSAASSKVEKQHFKGSEHATTGLQSRHTGGKQRHPIASRQAAASKPTSTRGRTFRATWIDRPRDAVPATSGKAGAAGVANRSSLPGKAELMQRRTVVTRTSSSGECRQKTLVAGGSAGREKPRMGAGMLFPKSSSTPGELPRTASGDLTHPFQWSATLASPVQPGRREQGGSAGRHLFAAAEVSPLPKAVPRPSSRVMAKAGSAKERQRGGASRGTGRLVRFDSLPEGTSLQTLLSEEESFKKLPCVIAPEGFWKGSRNKRRPVDSPAPVKPSRESSLQPGSSTQPSVPEPATSHVMTPAAAGTPRRSRAFLPSKSMPAERKSKAGHLPVVRTKSSVSRKDSVVSHSAEALPLPMLTSASGSPLLTSSSGGVDFPGGLYKQLSMGSAPSTACSAHCPEDDMGCVAKKTTWRQLLKMITIQDKKHAVGSK